MVISGVNTVTYNGDGITTAWPYTYEVTAASEIRIQLNNADGTAVIIESDYYVDLINSTVYYPGYAPGSEPPEAEQPPKVQTGQTITVYREIPITQESDLGEKWPFEVIEKGLDKLTMIAQQIDSGTKRTIDNALASMFQLAGIVTDSDKLQHITDQLNTIDDKAEAAADSAEDAEESATAAANSATDAATFATGAANSATSASNTAAALTTFLETKETLTAPAVDATLTISGAAADAQVVGENLNYVNNSIESAIINKVVPATTLNNNTRISSAGDFVSSTAYVTYTFALNGAKKIMVEAGNYNTTASQPTRSCAFYSTNVFTYENAIRIEDGLPLNTPNAVYEYAVPAGATYCAISGSKTRPEGANEPNAKLYLPKGAAAEQSETIIATQETATYQTHRYLDGDGVPYSTTSSNWDMYKIDVSGCNDVSFETYHGGSISLVMWSVTKNAFADVTGTSETSADIVAVSPKYPPSADPISCVAKIPTTGKTLLIAVYTGHSAPIVTKRYYNLFPELEDASDIAGIKSKVNSLVVYKDSPYYRDVRWGCPQFAQYYHSVDDGTSLFTSTTTAAQYFTMLNNLVAQHSGYAESHEMGVASDGTTMMYYYTLTPKTNQDSATYKRPKIMVSAGQHGFEKTANFGVYWLIKNILEDWQGNPYLDYLRNHVELIFMPMLNPYGFDHDSYTNANGVNLNRNWDTSGWSKGTPGTTSYGGEAPFDQVETQYARDVILANMDALWLCDYHNNGQVAPSSPTGYLWHSFALVTYNDPYFKNSIQAAKWHIDETTGHLYVDYPDQCSYVNSGHWTDNNAPSHQGLITAYCRDNGIMAETMEGCAAFIGSGNRYSSPIHHMNADLLGNWIRCLLATYSHLAE